MRGEAGTHELPQLRDGGRFGVRLQLDDGRHALAPVRVLQSEHDGVGDRGVLVENVFDLARVDILTAADDHVLEAAGHGDVAARVHLAEVTGVQPAVGVDRGGRRLGHVQVLDHPLVATCADLTFATDRHRLPGGVEDGDVDVPQGPSGGGAVVLDRVVGARLRHDRAQLGLAVHRAETDAEGPLARLDLRRRHAVAAGHDQLQAVDVVRVQIWVGQ